MILQTIYAKTITNNGTSYNVLTNQFGTDKGFMVSLPNRELRVPIELFNPQIIQNFINSNIELLNNKDNFLGTWVDNGYVYLDVSKCYKDIDTAIRIGMLSDQLAIYDNANQTVINLPKRQTSGTFFQQNTYINLTILKIKNK